MGIEGAVSHGTAHAAGGHVPSAADEERWAAIVERFAPYVHAVLVRAYGLDRQRAEEAFGEVFARLWLHVDGVISRNRDLGMLVRSLARGVAAEVAAPGDPPPRDDLLRELDDALAVRDALASLPALEREVLVRQAVREEEDAGIARALGLSVEAVAVEGSRARRHLRETLDSVSQERMRAPEPG